MRIQVIILIGFFLNACTPRVVQPSAPTEISPPATPTVSADALIDKMTSIAIADLSARLVLDPKRVRVLSTESQFWPDTSLGCPQSGMVYAQQTVPGYRLRLEANGQEYEYHSDMDETTILCDSTLEANRSENGIDQNLDDGWPNESRDKDVIFVTPAKNP